MVRILYLALPLLLCTCVSAQDLAFFETFTDHAILQRNVEHPIWGWAAAGAEVNLEFTGQTINQTADAEGRWEVTLPPQTAGGPHRITIRSGSERVSITDVYFGDVYLLSGQSNMEWQLERSDPGGERAAAIADPLIREIKASKEYAATPGDHLVLDSRYVNRWMVGGAADTIKNFSAVGSYFAHYVRKEVDVPIGLLHSSWGGSRIEPWMSPKALGNDEVGKPTSLDEALAEVGRPGRAKFARDFPGAKVPTEDRGEAEGWLRTGFDDAKWPTMTLPTFWEEAGYPNVDGTFYFRRAFDLTAEQAAASATLHLGPVDDGDWTYVNGELVGSYPNAYSTKRVYEVPAGALRAGTNHLSIKVVDGGGGGGFSTDPDSMYLQTGDGRVGLAGDYKYNVGEFRVDVYPNQIASLLYNAMIAPLVGMPLAGVLWYQGESNAGHGDNVKYANLMRGLIQQWRGEFSHPDTLPFYWVQLANFQAPPEGPNEPGWAILRAEQTAALDQPVTGQAVITDIGEADDIHPRNKWEVGRRLSLLALRDVYGKDVVASSPTAGKIEQLSERLTTITFDNVGERLVTTDNERYGAIRGFTAQDAEGQWHFAPAVISGKNTVTVIHPEGKALKAIRYNWANNPDGNLFSSEGLPADGFEYEFDQ